MYLWLKLIGYRTSAVGILWQRQNFIAGISPNFFLYPVKNFNHSAKYS